MAMYKNYSIKELTYGFFISRNRSTSTYLIAKSINLDEEECKFILRTRFLGITNKNGDIYFKHKKYAKKAIEWLESMIIMNNLGGNGFETYHRKSI